MGYRQPDGKVLSRVQGVRVAFGHCSDASAVAAGGGEERQAKTVCRPNKPRAQIAANNSMLRRSRFPQPVKPLWKLQRIGIREFVTIRLIGKGQHIEPVYQVGGSLKVIDAIKDSLERKPNANAWHPSRWFQNSFEPAGLEDRSSIPNRDESTVEPRDLMQVLKCA